MANPGDIGRDGYDYERPRSIFSAMWFRALLVVLVLGVAAALAVPRVLDYVNRASPKQTLTAALRQAFAPAAPAPPAPLTPSPPMAAAPTETTPSVTPAPSMPPPASSSPSVAAPNAPMTPSGSTEGSPKASTPATDDTASVAITPVTPPAPPAGKALASQPYWVQLGAFKSEATAKRLAAKLRGLNYEVHESTISTGATGSAGAALAGPSPTDRYDVFVSGAGSANVKAKLAAKGLDAEPVAGGVVVKPSLPLRDAVSLSRDLAVDGVKVQVRRVSGMPSAPPPPAGASERLYRVRVGQFADHAAAQATAKELQAKGYKGFIARGPE